ncbi:MAG: HD domain-containing protein [Eubacteriales bacterium]|nr:HD domain-containing protein [Eubacteriales bacterium]
MEIKNEDLMKMDLVDRAASFCKIKHKGQLRKNGDDYATHPFLVARMLQSAGFDAAYQVAAYLHDTLEDTDTTEDELEELFGKDIAHSVVLLTRMEGMKEDAYVDGVLTDHVAAVVKAADKVNNVCEITALDGVGNIRTEKNIERAKKYIAKAQKYYKGLFCPFLDEAIDYAALRLQEETAQDVLDMILSGTQESYKTYKEIK